GTVRGRRRRPRALRRLRLTGPHPRLRHPRSGRSLAGLRRRPRPRTGHPRPDRGGAVGRRARAPGRGSGRGDAVSGPLLGDRPSRPALRHALRSAAGIRPGRRGPGVHSPGRMAAPRTEPAPTVAAGRPFHRGVTTTHRCGSPGGSHRGLFAIRRPDSRAGSAAGPRLAFESCWEDSLKSHIDHRDYFTNKSPRLIFVDWFTRIKGDLYINPENPTPSPPQEDVETLLTPS